MAADVGSKLYYAIKDGKIKKAEELIESGADVNYVHRERYNRTLLFPAAYRGHSSLVQLLLDHGANPIVEDGSGSTPLMEACWSGKLESVKSILKSLDTRLTPQHVCRDQINAVNKESGMTPLMFAARDGHLEVCQHLVERGADLNVIDTDGMTALHVACKSGQLNIVTLLLSKSSQLHLNDLALEYAGEGLDEVEIDDDLTPEEKLAKMQRYNDIITKIGDILKSRQQHCGEDKEDVLSTKSDGSTSTRLTQQLPSRIPCEASKSESINTTSSFNSSSSSSNSSNNNSNSSFSNFEIPSNKLSYTDFHWTKKILGQGEFGVVKKAVYIDLKIPMRQPVAIKEMKLNFHDVQVEQLEFLKSLNHPNIIKFYGYFQHRNKHYIVMEICVGETLLTFLKKTNRLCWEKLRDFTKQICEALSYLETRKVVHRDLKSSNIFVLRQRRNASKQVLKLIDFDFVRRLNESQENQSLTEVGTLNWMAPETLELGIVDCRSDVWSLGCVLYEMANPGKPPFSSDKRETDYKTIRLIVMEQEPSIDENGNYPLEISEIMADFYKKMFDKRLHDA